MPVSHTHRACSRRERERENLFPAKHNFVNRSFKECLREEEDFFLLENVRQFIYFLTILFVKLNIFTPSH